MATTMPAPEFPRRSKSDRRTSNAPVEPERWSDLVSLPTGELAMLVHVWLTTHQWTESPYRTDPAWRHRELGDGVVAYRFDA